MFEYTYHFLYIHNVTLSYSNILQPFQKPFVNFWYTGVSLVVIFIFPDMRMSASMYEIFNWGFGSTPNDINSSCPIQVTSTSANIGIELLKLANCVIMSFISAYCVCECYLLFYCMFNSFMCHVGCK